MSYKDDLGYHRGQSRRHDIDLKISPNMIKERTWKSKPIGYTRFRLFEEGHIVEDAYEDGEIIDVRFFNTAVFTIWNKHATYELLYKILGCIDPSHWEELKPETIVDEASKAPPVEIDVRGYAFVKMQVKNQTATERAKVEAYAGVKA